MKITAVTGLCGSGKTYFCSNKNYISYDDVYSYSDKKLNYIKINNLLENFKNYDDEIYLDAFNTDLIEYIKSKLSLSNDDFRFIFIYTDIDDYYEIIAIKEPRQFNELNYDKYVESIVNTIIDIQNTINKFNIRITYKYRQQSNYTDFDNDEHLKTILNTSKEERLLHFIDNTSGAKNYQSIILNENYIRKGTEKDWISFDNILKCTSLKDKIICDTGCFNGYFSFRSIKEGAKKVIGIDHNIPAINICNKIAIYNNYHQWQNGIKTDVSCELGLEFYLKKIGRDNIFDEVINNHPIDIIFALNYLHHLKNELGFEAFFNTVDSYFKNAKEIIFEINENEIEDISKLANINHFSLQNKIESHRKTAFGNRFVMHYKKNV